MRSVTWTARLAGASHAALLGNGDWLRAHEEYTLPRRNRPPGACPRFRAMRPERPPCIRGCQRCRNRRQQPWFAFVYIPMPGHHGWGGRPRPPNIDACSRKALRARSPTITYSQSAALRKSGSTPTPPAFGCPWHRPHPTRLTSDQRRSRRSVAARNRPHRLDLGLVGSIMSLCRGSKAEEPRQSLTIWGANQDRPDY